MAEQGESHSEELEQQDLSQEDHEKLTALMDEQGSLPPHSSAEVEPEQEAEDESAHAPEEQPQGQVLEDIEYEGKKYSLPPEIKGALLRQQDYTRKTQEVASERAAATQERQTSQALMVNAQRFVGQLSAVQDIDRQLGSIQAAFQQDPQMSVNDPIKSQDLRLSYSELLRAREGAVQNLNLAMQWQAQAEAQAVQAATNQGMQILSRDIPGWGTETQQALVSTAVSGYGFQPHELQGLTDPRMVKVLHDAHQWRALQAKTPQTVKRVQQAPPKPVRAGPYRDQSEVPVAAKEIARLRRTGSDDDALAALRKLNIG